MLELVRFEALRIFCSTRAMDNIIYYLDSEVMVEDFNTSDEELKQILLDLKVRKDSADGPDNGPRRASWEKGRSAARRSRAFCSMRRRDCDAGHVCVCAG